jgi:hypothetical protein
VEAWRTAVETGATPPWLTPVHALVRGEEDVAVRDAEAAGLDLEELLVYHCIERVSRFQRREEGDRPTDALPTPRAATWSARRRRATRGGNTQSKHRREVFEGVFIDVADAGLQTRLRRRTARPRRGL